MTHPGGRVDVPIMLSVMPVILGLVVLGPRLSLRSIWETPAVVALGVLVSIGYPLAGQVPGGTACADHHGPHRSDAPMTERYVRLRTASRRVRSGRRRPTRR